MLENVYIYMYIEYVMDDSDINTIKIYERAEVISDKWKSYIVGTNEYIWYGIVIHNIYYISYVTRK